MKPIIFAVLTLACAATATASPAQSAPDRNSLQFKDCIRLDQINEWHVVDPQTILVRTGPYQRYLIKLKASCDKLGIGNPGVEFIPNNADKASAPLRMCGGAGTMVRSNIQPPCAVDTISLIDEPTFDRYRTRAKYHSTSSQQPAGTHP